MLFQFSSVAQSCYLCDPMDCSMLGLPTHCQLPELIQTQVHMFLEGNKRNQCSGCNWGAELNSWRMGREGQFIVIT